MKYANDITELIGNALATVCVAKGIKLILTRQSSMSLERRTLFQALGMEFVLTELETGMKAILVKNNAILAKGY